MKFGRAPAIMSTNNIELFEVKIRFATIENLMCKAKFFSESA